MVGWKEVNLNTMRHGQRVRVKKTANAENWHLGRSGTVIADSEPGEVVLVEFDDEAVGHQFLEHFLFSVDHGWRIGTMPLRCRA
jgi:hypothetical protein